VDIFSSFLPANNLFSDRLTYSLRALGILCQNHSIFVHLALFMTGFDTVFEK